jgi:hypothetical protein
LAGEVARHSQPAIDALWDVWLDDPDDAVWTLLERAGRPAGRHRAAYVPSLVALGHGSLELTSREHQHAVLEAARRTGHPLGRPARRRMDELWAMWLATGDSTIWEVLDRWRHPAQPAGIEASSVVALGHGDELSDPAVRAALLDAAGRVDHPIGAIARRRLDDAWGRWLAKADDRLADLLWEWGRPAISAHESHLASVVALGPPTLSMSAPAHRHALIELAHRTDHPIGDAARATVLAAGDEDLIDRICRQAGHDGADGLAAFCVEHRLAPADPVRRAAFLLLTGQASRYRAADPDGSMLAMAYQAADVSDRRRLREAMVRAGDLDVMRVLIGPGSPDRPGRLSAAERRFLSIQLAERRAWSQLWALLRELPLLDAAEAARSFEDGWQPATEAGRRLFARLRSADLDLLAKLAGRDRNGRAGMVRGHHGRQLARTRVATTGEVLACAVSPDSRQVALMVQPSPYGPRVDLRVFDLLGDEWVEVYEDVGGPWSAQELRRGGRLLHLGDAVVGCRRLRGVGTWPYSEVLERFAAGPARVLCQVRGNFALAPTTGGFVALDADADFVHPTVREARHLWFFTTSGELVRKVPLGDLGVRPGFGSRAEVLDVDPVTRRLALGGSDGLTILDPTADRIVDRWSSVARKRTVAASSPAVGHHGVWFAGPDRLVTADGDSRLRSWSLHDGRLGRDTADEQPDRPDRRHGDGPPAGELAFVPAAARVEWTPVRRAPLDWVDGPHGLAGVPGLRLWGSPGRDLYLLGSGGQIDAVSAALVVLTRRLPELVGNPLAEACRRRVGRRQDGPRQLGATPAEDLAAVRAALGSPLLTTDVRSSLELLCAWLADRFGAELALGDGGPASGADPHGISLAPAEQQRFGAGAPDGGGT